MNGKEFFIKIFILLAILLLKSVFLFPDTSSDANIKYSADISSDQIQADQKILLGILNNELVGMGVSGDWLKKNIESKDFLIYKNIRKYFENMAEYRARNKTLDYEAYTKNLGIELKAAKGAKFVSDNLELLNKIQSKNGIDKELIAAIIGIETDYANIRQKGNFNVFNTLLSQYILMDERKYFSKMELAALYKFSLKTGRPVNYFIGSFAGACGWGQFIPSSLNKFFIDTNKNDGDIDIYALDDTLSSIENYLFNSGLNINTINDKDKLYFAVYTYNRSDYYVRAVLYIYQNIKEKLSVKQ
jgi:membrane-bound lytic murein transglycosylase B